MGSLFRELKTRIGLAGGDRVADEISWFAEGHPFITNVAKGVGASAIIGSLVFAGTQVDNHVGVVETIVTCEDGNAPALEAIGTHAVLATCSNGDYPSLWGGDPVNGISRSEPPTGTSPNNYNSTVLTFLTGDPRVTRLGADGLRGGTMLFPSNSEERLKTGFGLTWVPYQQESDSSR